MIGRLLLIAAVILPVVCSAVSVRDGSGRIVGNVSNQGNRTIYRDGSGRVQGSADKVLPSPDKTIYGLKKGKK